MLQPTRLFDLLQFQLENTPGINIFSSNINGDWIGISTADFMKRVDEIAKGLIAAGIQKDEKVALISENRLEWNLLDFAIQQVGAVVVAIYPNISDNDYQFILNNAEVKLCFVSNEKLYRRLDVVQSSISSMTTLLSLDKIEGIPHWQELIEKGNDISNDVLKQRKEAVETTDLATLIYTSGTTGEPKGVMLTHENLLADVISSEYSFPVVAYDKALTFLPACHAYERVFQYVYIKIGLPMFYARSMDTIGEDIKSVQPQIFSAVPRVLEKVYEKIMATGEQLTGVKRTLFFWAISLADNFDVDETKLSAWYKFKLAIARKLIFSKWKEALGGNIKGIASGSATLQSKLIKVFLAAGIPIYEGYGLTEAGPCLSVNCIKRGVKIGTVGLPLVGIDIKLADDGEVLAKGKNIMLGYYKNPVATAEVLKDGWLHTGDIGAWDGKFLKIIDRKKEMFKTSGGKYIVPQQMESKFSESKFIEQIMVVGDGKKFASALIVPSYTAALEWLKSIDVKFSQLSPSEMIENSHFIQKISDEVNKINEQFGSWEKIKKFKLIPKEFSIETGELTPTLKIKRKIIEQKFSNEIAAMYV